MRPYQDERDKEVPCSNVECEYLDKSYDQNCSLEKDGEPAVITCKRYMPLVSNREKGNK
jgi:hypothetical protein